MFGWLVQVFMFWHCQCWLLVCDDKLVSSNKPNFLVAILAISGSWQWIARCFNQHPRFHGGFQDFPKSYFQHFSTLEVLQVPVLYSSPSWVLAKMMWSVSQVCELLFILITNKNNRTYIAGGRLSTEPYKTRFFFCVCVFFLAWRHVFFCLNLRLRFGTLRRALFTMILGYTKTTKTPGIRCAFRAFHPEDRIFRPFQLIRLVRRLKVRGFDGWF